MSPAPPAPDQHLGPLTRLFTAPLSPTALERRAREAARPAVRWLRTLLLPLALFALGYALFDLWSRRPPLLVPRHRAEALCFALAQRPAFTPPMTVEPSAALVRGRFSTSTPPGFALRRVIHFSDAMVLRERFVRVGDFNVSVLWLRFPGGGQPRHWLIVGWMEGADLAVCNFRFAAEGDTLSPAEEQWGDELLARVLVPENFRADHLPPVRLRVPRGSTMPVFGPKRAG